MILILSRKYIPSLGPRLRRTLYVVSMLLDTRNALPATAESSEVSAEVVQLLAGFLLGRKSSSITTLIKSKSILAHLDSSFCSSVHLFAQNLFCINRGSFLPDLDKLRGPGR